MNVLITGASGSGTTTVGAAIAERYAFTHLDTDDYFWLPGDPPFSQKRNPQEKLALILDDISRSSHAVISGSIMKWGNELEDNLDLIVFLTLDTSIRVERLVKRELNRFGSVDPKFIEWASLYDTGTEEGRSRAKHTAWLEQRSCPIIHIEGDTSTEERISQIAAYLTEIPLRTKVD